jgi:hypothetical protein
VKLRAAESVIDHAIKAVELEDTVTGASPSPLGVPAVELGVYHGIFATNYTFPAGQSFSASNASGGNGVQGFNVSVRGTHLVRMPRIR